MARPTADIDWKVVDKFLMGGADGVQIAGHLGIAPDTLYHRCQHDHKIGFSHYCQEKRSAGDALLHAAQFNKALKGDSGMLKWLGIHRLNQKETNLSEVEEASKRGAIDAVREIQAETRARNGATSRSHMEAEQSLLDQNSEGKPHQISDECHPTETL